MAERILIDEDRFVLGEEPDLVIGGDVFEAVGQRGSFGHSVKAVPYGEFKKGESFGYIGGRLKDDPDGSKFIKKYKDSYEILRRVVETFRKKKLSKSKEAEGKDLLGERVGFLEDIKKYDLELERKLKGEILELEERRKNLLLSEIERGEIREEKKEKEKELARIEKINRKIEGYYFGRIDSADFKEDLKKIKEALIFTQAFDKLHKGEELNEKEREIVDGCSSFYQKGLKLSFVYPGNIDEREINKRKIYFEVTNFDEDYEKRVAAKVGLKKIGDHVVPDFSTLRFHGEDLKTPNTPSKVPLGEEGVENYVDFKHMEKMIGEFEYKFNGQELPPQIQEQLMLEFTARVNAIKENPSLNAAPAVGIPPRNMPPRGQQGQGQGRGQ